RRAARLARLVGTGKVPLVFGFGELVAERGASRDGRAEPVGVMASEFMRRGRGVEGTRGDAIVDMAAGWNGVERRIDQLLSYCVLVDRVYSVRHRDLTGARWECSSRPQRCSSLSDVELQPR